MIRYLWSLPLVLCAIGMEDAPRPDSSDWPQWQGPDRNAVSRERGLLKEWPKDGPPLAWKALKLGGGDSAPSIAGGRIFGMSIRDKDEVVWALSEKDGKELWWSRLGIAYAQRMPQSREGPGCTPTVDGDRLYVLGMAGDLACMQIADGKILWQRSLTKEFGGVIPMWSYRESPLIDGNKVVCTPGGSDATLVALDKMTGKTIWKTKLPEKAEEKTTPPPPGKGRGGRGFFTSSGAAYSSVIAIDLEGQRQYVQLTSKALLGVSASDGKFLWRYDAPANRMGINCSTPLFHDGKIFAASAYGAGGGLVKLTRDGEKGFQAEEVYFTNKMQNHHGGMIVNDGALYGANGGNEGGHLICLDFLTGKIQWDERSRGRAGVRKGSIAMADGRFYYRVEDGTVLLIEPNKEKYVEKGRFKQPDRSESPAWAHPVIANGKLYIRDQDVLLCYDVKAK
ncbi:MAG: PQQ-binding-like beta-propeller repeat protein [Gemmataceae bacterium]